MPSSLGGEVRRDKTWPHRLRSWLISAVRDEMVGAGRRQTAISSRTASEADRESGVVLGQAGGAGVGGADPAELGELELGVERVAGGVEHGGHPPGEVGAAPDATQGGVGVGVRQLGGAAQQSGEGWG